MYGIILLLFFPFIGFLPAQNQQQDDEEVVSEITFEEVNEKFGMDSALTGLQKSDEWKKYEAQCVTWVGELSSVEDMFSSITGITLGFKHLRSTLTYDVQISAPVTGKEAFLTLKKGNRYQYKATLQDYGGAILPIMADWGCSPDTDVTTNVEYHGIIEDQKPGPSDRFGAAQARRSEPLRARTDLKPETIEASWKGYKAEQEAKEIARQKREEEEASRKREKDLKASGRIPPVALDQPAPTYTEEARKARVQGLLLLRCVIRKDGRVDNCKVVRGLGFGLDEKSLWLVETYWRFRPATLHGQPVDEPTTFALQFELR